MENKVSILVPCFNNGDLLSKLIDSILNQTYNNWELIIVDDCSSDNTIDIIKKYANSDLRISFFIRDRSPKGAQTCRNIAMSNARGKYIVIFDADDLISKNCIENRVALMENNPIFDYISFPASTFIDEKKLPIFQNNCKYFGVGNENTDLLTSLLTVNYSSIVWTNIYKLSSLNNIRWDERIKVYQDFDFALSVVLSNLKHKFSGCKQIDYFYRVGNNNTISSSFVDEEKCESTIYLFSKTLELLKQREDYNKRKNEFKQFILLHFERLITDGNLNKINKYCEFCAVYYSEFFIARLNVVKCLSLIFNNVTFRKLIMYLLIGVIYCRKQSILMFGSIVLRSFRK